MTNEDFIKKVILLLFPNGESSSKEIALEEIKKMKVREVDATDATILFGVNDPLFAKYIVENTCASYVGSGDSFSLYEVENILYHMSDDDKERFPEAKTDKFLNSEYVEV